jgi:hypothetical protein
MGVGGIGPSAAVAKARCVTAAAVQTHDEGQGGLAVPSRGLVHVIVPRSPILRL